MKIPCLRMGQVGPHGLKACCEARPGKTGHGTGRVPRLKSSAPR
jgi:hypothetical protein